MGSISQGGEYEVETEEGAALGLGLLIKAGAPCEPVGDCDITRVCIASFLLPTSLEKHVSFFS